jgi:hypothetical protein
MTGSVRPLFIIRHRMGRCRLLGDQLLGGRLLGISSLGQLDRGDAVTVEPEGQGATGLTGAPSRRFEA